MAIPKNIPAPMPACAVVLRPEDCVSTDPDEGLPVALRVAEVARVARVVTAKLVGLSVFGIACKGSIFCDESVQGRFALVKESDICIAT
jgi:hypothetical protein